MTHGRDKAIPDDLDARKAATRTALLAIIHALLVILSYVLLIQAPNPTASDAEFATFYSSGTDRSLVVLTAVYLMPFAGIAFLWFIVVLRMWISSSAARIDALLSTAQLVSGVVYLGLFFAAAATISVLAVSTEYSGSEIDPSTARQFTQLGWALFVLFAMRMAAIFIMTTSSLGRRYGFLPRWFVAVGYVVGAVLLLTASTASFMILVMPGWLLVLGAIILVRARSLPRSLGIG